MEFIKYENHLYENPSFPIIYHYDELERGNSFLSHWHESIEILYAVNGETQVICNGVSNTFSRGEIAVINSGDIHEILAVTQESSYYCLIIDRNFCDSFGISVENKEFDHVIKDETVKKYFDMIEIEMKNKNTHYTESVKALCTLLMLECFRKYCKPYKKLKDKNYNRNQMVKDAISYLRSHFSSQISIDELCEYVGFSKYYFCREFKSLTGFTVVDYMNFLRCTNARRLMASGKYNVSQSAQSCGFNNLSYFTKVYKKHIGYSPSAELQGEFDL